MRGLTSRLEGGAGSNRWMWPCMAGLVPVLMLGCALALWWFDRQALGVASGAYLSPRTLWMNSAIGLLATLLLTALTRRVVFSLLLVFALQVLIYKASAIKMAVLGEPVALQDSYFLGSFNRASIELLGAYVTGKAKLVVAALAALSALAALFRYERPWMRPWRYTHLLIALLAAVGLVTLVRAERPWVSLYAKHNVRPSALGLAPAVLHSGLMSSLAYSYLMRANMRFVVDDGALRGALRALDAPAVPTVPTASAALAASAPPDIVVVLSESLMDPRVLRGMDGVADLVPNVRAQIGAGHGGMMMVPTFGGGTVRTEFEVLTGMPVDAFPAIRYPYVDLNLTRLPGLASVLRRHGYSTVALHGNSGSFWNRTNAYRAMDIQRFVTIRQLKEGGAFDGTWFSDKSMTDAIARELQATKAPLFLFAASIESHGPYGASDVSDPAARAAIALPAGLDAGAEQELRNYLYHAQHADHEYGRLLALLQQRGRPFVLLFFGDHLPSLQAAYGKLGFVDGRSAEQQYVPWVLASSGSAGRLDAANGPIYSWQLPAELLRLAGVDDDAYFDFILRAGRQLRDGQSGQEGMRAGVNAAAIAKYNGGFEAYLK
jgi:phosphoglycerol transferase MdoB-like AlkP superfamily enzyme